MARGLILIGAAVALSAAVPLSLSHVDAGLWELSGVPGSRGDVRVCVSEVIALAQFEHRGRHCTRSVVSDTASSTVVSYSCGSAGFGHSQVDVLTPRSLRISTQGISDQLPFAYRLQAHRVGDCTKSGLTSRH